MPIRNWLSLVLLFLTCSAWSAVSSEVSRSDFVGNGSVAAYSTTFPCKAVTELRVFKQDASGQDVELTYGGDYSAVINGSGLVTITLTAGNLTSGYKLSLQRGIPYTQTTTPGGAYSATAMATALDRLSMEVIRLKGDVDRAIKVPYLEAGGDAVVKIPDNATTRASLTLGFDVSGNIMVGSSPGAATVSAYGATLIDDTSAAAARITLGSVPVYVDTIAVLTARTGDDRVGTFIVSGYAAKGDGGGGIFYWDAANTTTEDSGIHFDSDSGGTGRFIRVVPDDGYVNVKWFGATGNGSTDDRNSILFAATWMATNYANKGGCTLFFPAADVYYRMTNSIDFASIFSLTSPATQRLCQVNIEGVGRASYIRYEGSGTSLFKFGSYTNNVGMTGGVRRMRLGTNATLTHSITAYTPNFSTLASSLYGSSNTTTTAILADTVLTPFIVEQCEITGFNKAYQIRNGFCAKVVDCQIAKCNIGVHSGELTTSFTFSGNTIEECAVGWFIDSGCQMTVTNGISVIEANDVDILFYANTHLHTISGIYSEASRRSVFFSSDVTTDEFTPRQITFANCVGVDAEANSGLLEVRFVNCAFAEGLILGVNSGQRLQHIVIEDCFKDNRTAPFENSDITGSGIYTTYQDEVSVISTGVSPHAINRDPKVRPKSDMVTYKSFYATSADTLIEGFSVTVPNVKTSMVITIEGHKAYDIEAGGAIPNLVYFKYVSYVQRNTGAASTVTDSATENVWEDLSTTLTPHAVANPTTTITGAVGATQTIQYDFIQGYTTNISAGHYYKVTISSSVGGVAFQ